MNQILIDGVWRDADAVGEFPSVNPATGQSTNETFPISSQNDVESALEAAGRSADELRAMEPAVRANFLRSYADGIERRSDVLVHSAHIETALPVDPRLNGELARTVNQLQQAADAVTDGSWVAATIDTSTNIRSMYAPLYKPVVVFGPSNFPFAFNGISGGDFAAAVAAGNPVITKGHPGHPTTTRVLAIAAREAIEEVGAPRALVQLLYHLEPQTGLAFVSDRRVGAVGFTGSQRSGLALKEAADRSGVPISVEMGSINPVFLLQGVLRERVEDIVDDFYVSCTLGAGQYCTKPGMVVVPDSAEGDAFVSRAASRFAVGEPGVLFGPAQSLEDGVSALRNAGAEILSGGAKVKGPGFRFANTLLSVPAKDFLANSETFQREVFGPVSLVVRAAGPDEMAAVARSIEGNLAGSIYSADTDEDTYWLIESDLRPRVGRLLNNKMPTGVAVVPSMNHGGPYPATGHPGFTSVGVPRSITRFAALYCYDNVPQSRLPAPLRDENPAGTMWRYIDGRWTQDEVAQERSE